MVEPRLISATNPSDGVIIARFNRAMAQDVALRSLVSWRLEENSDNALIVSLAEVALNVAYPEAAFLRYTEGGGDYTLSVAGVRASDGTAIAPAFATVPLTISRPGEAEMTVRLFDSMWGPLGVAQRASRRRTVEQLVANRALALGVNQQLAQRLASGDTSAGLDGRPGLGRT